MIITTLPVIPDDPKAEEEVRKALLHLTGQINRELEAIKARLDALEATP